VYAARNAGMNADDLARIAAALVAAIAQAKTRAKTFGIDPDFREIVRQAREMHDLLTEALAENQSLSTAYLRDLSYTTGKAIDQLVPPRIRAPSSRGETARAMVRRARGGREDSQPYAYCVASSRYGE